MSDECVLRLCPFLELVTLVLMLIFLVPGAPFEQVRITCCECCILILPRGFHAESFGADSRGA
ncbi:hypothetical protein Micbo1qcDRAFT_158677 [Microdochium bolleyi]|uniref:Uncharacterized protein n=1 Tax=Microdochium bolleyi TaxID=196109 RepID=A0A136J9F4_9PEZI|nr:hypothetical protein Micbo1qcDRAFT_158677 [Microdochium bolleyi]